MLQGGMKRLVQKNNSIYHEGGKSMRQLTDLHHHFLYGLDDGPQTYEDMCRMLHKAADAGVSCLVATPHIQPGLVEFDYAQYQRSLAEAQQYAYDQHLPLTILPGAEIYYTSMTASMLQKGAVPWLGNGYHVLVEFHPSVSFEGICRAAIHIANAGYSMVLAHAERYRCLLWGRRLARLQEEYHVKIQVNTQTILSTRPFWMGLWVRRAMEHEWIDLIASDAHDSDKRPCNLDACAAWIEKNWGKKRSEKLCRLHANALLRR